MFKRIVIFPIHIVCFITFACSNSQQNNLPGHLQMVDQLTVYQNSSDVPNEINFIREQAFGDTGDLFFQLMYQVAVDEIGRVFISELAMGHRSIHAFDFEGNYLGNIGKQGDGPGEYQTPTQLQVVNGYLYIYDNLHQRISAFLLDTFSLSFEITLPYEKIRQKEHLAGAHLQQLFVRKDGTFLAAFGSLMPNISQRYDVYYVIGRDGNIQTEKIFKERAITIVGIETNGNTFEGMLPFSRKSLTALSDKDYIYSVWTEDILLKVYNPEGIKVNAFYYPFSNKLLNRDNFAEGLSPTGHLYQIIPYIEFPKSWPALDDMLIDDKNRLWISTIVEDFDIYEWWVLEETGELITKFEWPRDEPIEVVKNGYMYTRETDEETGLQQVVRYRIEITEGK